MFPGLEKFKAAEAHVKLVEYLVTLASDIRLGMLFCDFLLQRETRALCSKQHPFRKSVTSLNIYLKAEGRKQKSFLQRTGTGSLGVRRQLKNTQDFAL